MCRDENFLVLVLLDCGVAVANLMFGTVWRTDDGHQVFVARPQGLGGLVALCASLDTL